MVFRAHFQPVEAEPLSTATETTVTVIIPSRGGMLLERAVESVLAQKSATVEVIVALNGAVRIPVFEDSRVRVIQSRAEDGANGARQAGINDATTPLVALLDDDDYWEPTKLRAQLDALGDLDIAHPWIVGCRLVEHRDPVRQTIAPRFGIGPVADIGSYLFRRPKWKSDRPQLQTSTILFPASLGRKVQFQASRRFHQDWTWLLDAESVGARAYVVPETLVHRNVQSAGSISSKITWEDSLNWADEFIKDPRVFGDFALTMGALKAARTNDRIALRRCFVRGIRKGRPGIPAVAFWLSLYLRLLRQGRGANKNGTQS